MKQNFLFPGMKNTPELRQIPVEELKNQAGEPSNELTASVAAFGVLTPLVAQKNGKGLLVRAGTRRLGAAIKAGLSEVPVMMYGALSPSVTIIENAVRSRNFAGEFAAFERLADGGFSLDEICEKTGLSKGRLKPFCRLRQNLCSQAKEAFKEGLITFQTAKRLAQHQEEVQKKVIEGAESNKDVARRLDSVKAGPLDSLPAALFDERVTILNLLDEAKRLSEGDEALTAAIEAAIEAAKGGQA